MTSEIIKLPPHSLESEQSLIGALLIDNRVYDDVGGMLTGNDFYRYDHQRIYNRIILLIENNRPADVITVAESLQSEDIGDLSYLGKMARSCPAITNAKSYAKIIKNKSIARQLIAASETMNDLAWRESEPIETRLEAAQGLLTSLHEGSINEDPVMIHDILNDVVQNIDENFHGNGEITGLSTGLLDIDTKTSGLQKGDLIIVAGRPSMGKTALALQLAQNAAIDKKTVLIFSMEMSDRALVQRAISNVGRINGNALRNGKLKDDDWPKLTKAVGELHELKMLIDKTSAPTVSQMRAKARRTKRKYGLDLIVIDYLQLMSSSEKSFSRNDEISVITRSLKLMAKELDVPVVLLSQLSRKVEERADKRPIMSDLRESGSIEQDADVIMFVYRDEYYSKDKCLNPGVAEVIFAKQRMGEIGTVYLGWSGQYCRFDNHAGHYKTDNIKQFKRGFNE